jgi:spoIIIJ-associated protein
MYGDYEDQEDYEELSVEECALEVKEKINELFKEICFDLHEIEVSAYDENTLLVELTGVDSALMIGKEGYRYKALSYMLFNWINATYGLQLRLEIAEFLKNQEESIARYLVGVCESIEREGRGQTKTLDGVLVQIALKQLRDRYPDRYVAIRSTRDGGKFIVINSYHEY